MEDQRPLTPIERERLILRTHADANSRLIRRTGYVAIAAGMLLVAIIAAVAWFTVPIILADGEEIGGTRFEGGRGAAIAIFGIYGGVAAIGVLAMFNGAFHVVTGRRSTFGIRAMLFFAGLFVAAGMLARAFG